MGDRLHTQYPRAFKVIDGGRAERLLWTLPSMIEERTRAKEFRSIIMLITGIPIILGSWFTTNTFSVGDADLTVNTGYERSYSLGGRKRLDSIYPVARIPSILVRN
jgi:hypothetical protein